MIFHALHFFDSVFFSLCFIKEFPHFLVSPSLQRFRFPSTISHSLPALLEWSHLGSQGTSPTFCMLSVLEWLWSLSIIEKCLKRSKTVPNSKHTSSVIEGAELPEGLLLAIPEIPKNSHFRQHTTCNEVPFRRRRLVFGSCGIWEQTTDGRLK